MSKGKRNDTVFNGKDVDQIIKKSDLINGWRVGFIQGLDFAIVTMNDIVERLGACTWWEGKKRNLDQPG